MNKTSPGVMAITPGIPLAKAAGLRP